LGAVKQGTTGIPFLQGVRIAQSMDAKGKVSKGIFTFRVASSKQRGTGKWVHPGIKAKKFMDEGYDWALREWEDKIKPELLRGFQGNGP
jgi:hypothetical protein